MSLFDSIYQNAAVKTGLSEEELRALAQKVFATMLFHAAANEGKVVLTGMFLSGSRLEVEVNVSIIPGRKSTKFIFPQMGTNEHDYQILKTTPTTSNDCRG